MRIHYLVKTLLLSTGSCLVFASLVITSLANAGNTRHARMSPNELANQVSHFVHQSIETQNFAQQFTRFNVQVGTIDSRLKLTACDAKLGFKVHGKALKPGRQMIKVNCGAPMPWSIYIPVNLSAYRQIVVASRNLSRGTRLEAADLSLQEREITHVKSYYLAEKSQAVGQVLKRRISVGQVVSSPMLTPPKIVAKGQEVAIQAKSGPVSVRMVGIALADGKLGQQISVKNRRSKKVVRARVSAPGEVEVTM